LSLILNFLRLSGSSPALRSIVVLSPSKSGAIATMGLTIPEVSNESVKRITVAADQLYEENGKTSLPNVDAVRRRARVNMNDASIVMRVWRRAQTAAAAPLSAAIPETVQQASNALLAALWKVATDSANANLQAAQAGWELERGEAEECRQQISNAFDLQADELSAAQERLRILEQKLAAQTAQAATQADALNSMTQRASAAEAKVATLEARIQEIEKRAGDLRMELNLAHANAEQARRTAADSAEADQAQLARLNDALMRRVEADAVAREEAARLRGQLEALAAEHRALQGALKSNGMASEPGERHGAAKKSRSNPG
jgi:colicin import membrane protein